MLAAIIWGCAFVAQQTGGEAVGPYSFNCIRSIIGSIVLLPAIVCLDRMGLSGKKPVTAEQKKELWLGGLACGIFLFLASNMQQLGLYYGTGAGKAGFLTASYILLVPICGLFLHKTCGINVWIAVVMAMAGLYFLCITESLSVQKSDLYVLSCAVLFTGQILCVDHFSPKVDGVRLSCLEFLVTGVLGMIPMTIKEIIPVGFGTWLSNFQAEGAIIALLYAGVLSCGVAYTCQIIGQNGLNPAIASIVMSLESVFSVIAGAIILGERMNGREILGCVILFASILIAQMPMPNFFKENKNADHA